MKNKYLHYMGVMGVLTPLSLLVWIWWVSDVESLTALIPRTIKFYTFMGGLLISAAFAGITIYFNFKSRDHCVACGRDLERQIIQAEKLATVGQLAGGVAHEVNTPASIIAGRVEAMLLESNRFKEQERSDLSVIKKQAERITQITRGLLLFSKRAPAEKAKTDLNDIVRESVSLLETQLVKSKIQVARNIFPEPIFVLAQHNQIVQVLINLLTNARDAMPQGGNLTLKTGFLESRVRKALLQVEDTGEGIDPEVLPRIFDPFFTTKKNGIGLGLSVSYGIIQEHGGIIRVNSETGKGTTFSITLPLAS